MVSLIRLIISYVQIAINVLARTNPRVTTSRYAGLMLFNSARYCNMICASRCACNAIQV